MKRIFTICVPDDCYLKVANIVAVVEKDDHSENGVTIFTTDSVGDEEQEWMFTTEGKAKQVVVINMKELKAYREQGGDAISRKYILDLIATKGANLDDDLLIVEQWIQDAPSVTPQPKMGHWIFDEILDKHYYCSECKSMGVDYWDYCPNCGARMEVEE